MKLSALRSSGRRREDAAVAVGLDALFIEVHPDPDKALSDSAAQLSFEAAERLLRQIAAIGQALRED